MNYCFAIVDLTTSATPSNLRPAGALASMIAAWEEELNGRFAAAWGARNVAFRIASGPQDRQPGELAINIRDNIPEAPQALAYHQVVNGIPDIEVGADLFQSIGDGGESMSMGVDHEIKELFGDIGANAWADRQDGSGQMDAYETCDFVQNVGRKASGGLMVSNFVLPTFFIPGSAGPWDDMGSMKSQYDVSNGYGIQGGSPSTTSQIGGAKAMLGENIHRGMRVHLIGNLSDLQLRRKRHAYSRTSRRGILLTP